MAFAVRPEGGDVIACRKRVLVQGVGCLSGVIVEVGGNRCSGRTGVESMIARHVSGAANSCLATDIRPRRTTTTGA